MQKIVAVADPVFKCNSTIRLVFLGVDLEGGVDLFMYLISR